MNLATIINKAAQEHWLNTSGDQGELDFKAGANWATTHPEILRELFNSFHKWIDEMGIYKDVYGEYYHVPNGSAVLIAKNERELSKKYLQHIETLKQKEDGGNCNS